MSKNYHDDIIRDHTMDPTEVQIIDHESWLSIELVTSTLPDLSERTTLLRLDDETATALSDLLNERRQRGEIR